MRPKISAIVAAKFFGLITVGCPTAFAQTNCSADAQAFWGSFRAAVLKRDMTVIMRNTQFPFALSGSLDASRKTVIADRKQFISAFPAMLNSDPGLTAEPSTMAALVRSVSTLTVLECANGADQIRVGDWIFQRKGADWRFVHSVVAD